MYENVPNTGSQEGSLLVKPAGHCSAPSDFERLCEWHAASGIGGFGYYMAWNYNNALK